MMCRMNTLFSNALTPRSLCGSITLPCFLALSSLSPTLLRGTGRVNVLEPFISQLFKLMLDEACIPEFWKAAKVTPLHERGMSWTLLQTGARLRTKSQTRSMFSILVRTHRRQAYNTILRDKPWEHFQRICMPAHMLAVIKNLYEDDENVLVLMDGLKQAAVSPTWGVEQRCPLSPPLLAL
eukprot:1160228-Pelagomonas_calceolata.AAC.9